MYFSISGSSTNARALLMDYKKWEKEPVPDLFAASNILSKYGILDILAGALGVPKILSEIIPVTPIFSNLPNHFQRVSETLFVFLYYS